jgi:hypothetical protein
MFFIVKKNVLYFEMKIKSDTLLGCPKIGKY